MDDKLNNAKFNIYLYDNQTTYFNYNNRTPEYNLASNYEENIFTWSLPYGIDNSYVVIVETTDNCDDISGVYIYQTWLLLQ